MRIKEIANRIDQGLGLVLSTKGRNPLQEVLRQSSLLDESLSMFRIAVSEPFRLLVGRTSENRAGNLSCHGVPSPWVGIAGIDLRQSTDLTCEGCD